MNRRLPILIVATALVGLGIVSTATGADPKVKSEILDRVPPGQLEAGRDALSLEERRRLRNNLRRRGRDAEAVERNQIRAEREKWRNRFGDEFDQAERDSLRERIRERTMRHERGGDHSTRERPKLKRPLQELDSGERQSLRRRLRELSPTEREELRGRIREFRSLAADERSEIRAQLEELRQLPKPERDRLESNRERWKSLSADERKSLREKMRRFRQLTPEAREEFLDRVLGRSAESGNEPQ